MTKHLIRAALALLLTAPFTVHAQNKPIDFNPKMPFSNGFVAGNTLYVAGQQGPDDSGKVTGTTIEFQTERTIAAIKGGRRKSRLQDDRSGQCHRLCHRPE